MGWKGSEGRRQSKSRREAAAPGRLVRIALRLRLKSRMTPGCITQRLQMGTKTYLSPLLYWRGGSEGSTGAPANETTSRFTKKRLWLTHELLSEVIRRGRWKRLLTANMVGFTTAIVHITVEEEVVLLYALYACGRKPSKARATGFIMSNRLLKEREGDLDVVSTGETRVENRIQVAFPLFQKAVRHY